MNNSYRELLIEQGIITPEKGEEEMKGKNKAGDNNHNNFHNPYHFVPVDKPEFSRWHETGVSMTTRHRRKEFNAALPSHLRHDIYITKTHKGEEVYHGRIHCTLKTETPIFIGARRIKKGPEDHPACLAPFELDDKPAIPASTLRGLISSVAEAASNSALRVLEKKFLSVRKPPSQFLKGIGMVVKKGDNAFALFPLRIAKKFRQDRDALGKKLVTYSIENNQFYYADLKNSEDKKKVNLVRAEDASESQKREWTKGIVRYFPVKFGEKRVKNFFIPFSEIVQDKLIPIPSNVEEIFLGMANDRAQATKNTAEILPYIPEGALRNESSGDDNITVTLKTGDIVFYSLDNEKNEVKEIAFSQIWRKYCGGTVHDFFSLIDKELLPFNPERNYISPAELMFGFVEDWAGREDAREKEALAYKGRVRFSHGLLEDTGDESPYDDEVTLKILDSPKPPCPCLYFEEDDNPKAFISKQELECNGTHRPKGRKFYLHHKPELETRKYKGKKLPPWQTHPNLTKPGVKESRLKQKVCITPIKTGRTFRFYIDFENLNYWELGLLCYALKPNEKFRHKIGLGKSIGLGTVEITPQKIEFIHRSKRYLEDDVFNGERYGSGAGEKTTEYFAQYFKGPADNKFTGPLEFLGDKGAVQFRVHTPLHKGQKGKGEELETYKWFKINEDKGEQQQLESLRDNNKMIHIPHLKRNEKKEKKKVKEAKK